MVYEPTEEIDGEITPVAGLIASPLPGETEKFPPAGLNVGEKLTVESTFIQLL